MAPQQSPNIGGRTILYYPTIAVPAGRWLRQALLYWDQIGSIVPHDVENRDLVHYSPDIEFLKKKNVFRPFRPETIWQRGGTFVDEFKSELFDSIGSKAFRKLLPPVAECPFSARVHKDKVSTEIYRALKEKHLAKEKPHDPFWYYFENATAHLYLAKLAKYLAAGDEQLTVVGTDLPEYELLNFGTDKLENGVVTLTAGILKVLPVPRADASVRKIWKFKQHRTGYLLHFRQMLDDFETKLTACTNEVEIKSAGEAFCTKLKDSLTQLEEVLKDGKIPTILGSMESLIKVNSPTWMPAASGGWDM
jgi:Family of unknown function (DUF6236)